ncbi:MAG: HEPN domain-containing protein [Prolixibacteraceae bacterium]|jgi:HEPN domain-containing protein|nr:HEPN domain-containing protein [Prolixibacteraceae bacterium]MBT6005159.1 HEPN domain-containing protein [Prolixibacteraceae bacterium]MBT6766477.1 HEPN domain-containing protein [Prolixibacteraceae bacterium]MBT6997733.1 HEPN domain-containing protein [Prolixibacteraceae bacterium]MBT7396495.1 HEPN domain-containing protein [Prolixibacteraceae bacterium]
MKDEAKIWLSYALENLKSSEILLESSLFNPCLQNAQQCVEKSMKALLIEKGITTKKTHDIFEINRIIKTNKIQISITDDECDIINTIYLPSKYPLGSVLPDFIPDHKFCKEIITISKKVYFEIEELLHKKSF